jgi:hypothetical protein
MTRVLLSMVGMFLSMEGVLLLMFEIEIEIES